MNFKYNIGDAVKVDNSQSYYRIDSILITESNVLYNLSRRPNQFENKLDYPLMQLITEDRLGHRIDKNKETFDAT